MTADEFRKIVKSKDKEKIVAAIRAIPVAPFSDDSLAEFANLSDADLGGADLSEMILRRVNFNRCNLKGANLVKAKLDEANLCAANLEEAALRHAVLAKADLTGAKLRFASLTHAYLREARLSGANLRDADLEEAELKWTDLDRATLCRANLKGAKLQRANMRGANLVDACLFGADLSHADLRGAILTNANLERANLRGAWGIRLDGNNIAGLQLSPGCDESWHIVRRAYTGAKFFFHLLLMAAFFGGYALRFAMWNGVNRAQVAIVNSSTKLEHASERLAQSNPEAAALLACTADELKSVTKSLTEKAKQYAVWQVLLGLDRGPWTGILALLLVTYNAGRWWLTYTVGAMREEEERTHYAPYWDDYRATWYVHIYLMRWLMYVALISFAWHAWGWLSSPVYLPA